MCAASGKPVPHCDTLAPLLGGDEPTGAVRDPLVLWTGGQELRRFITVPNQPSGVGLFAAGCTAAKRAAVAARWHIDAPAEKSP